MDGEGPDKKRASAGTLDNGVGDVDPAGVRAGLPGRNWGRSGRPRPRRGQPSPPPWTAAAALINFASLRCPSPAARALQGPMEVLDIPSAQVGKLIGKAGETIRNLQLSTDTRIQVDHACEGDTKRVTITGMSA